MPHAEGLINLLVTQAKGSDHNALRLCVERLIPRLKSEGPTISLPQVNTMHPDALETVRRALLLSLAQQEEISIDSLKTILELYKLSKDMKENTDEVDAAVVRMNKIVQRLLKEPL